MKTEQPSKNSKIKRIQFQFLRDQGPKASNSVSLGVLCICRNEVTPKRKGRNEMTLSQTISYK